MITKSSAGSKWVKQARRQVDRATSSVARHTGHFITGRLDHIRAVRRDVVLWLCLILLLICCCFAQAIRINSRTMVKAAAPGGNYVEGVVDKLTTISPLYANTDTEKAASQLVYPGLLSYDSANKLHGQLAHSWQHDDSGKVWTIKLKSDLKWADGQALTASDVVHTLALMKKPEINSAISSSWQTITATAKDTTTVEFTLPAPLMSFDSALTFGVLPKHILEGKSAIEIADLSNKQPAKLVGAGPFSFAGTEKSGDSSTWRFQPNPNYYGDPAKLSTFTIRTYSDNSSLVKGLISSEVNAISGVKIDSLPQLKRNFKLIQLKTADGVFAIFNNEADLTGDPVVRRALRLGLDRSAIRKQVLSGSDNRLHEPTALETPIATGVYDQVDRLKQPDYNLEEAKKMLDGAGWVQPQGSDYRQKSGAQLNLNIITIADTNYQNVARLIAQQWKKLGVNAQVRAIPPSGAQQNYLAPRNYDVLVYQIHLGADPDMFAYWSSTQTQASGLNLANYRSRRAEIALSAGRSNANPEARQARYVAFVHQWLKDCPAIALYQPSLIYATEPNVRMLNSGAALIDAGNRYQATGNWTGATRMVMTTP